MSSSDSSQQEMSSSTTPSGSTVTTPRLKSLVTPASLLFQLPPEAAKPYYVNIFHVARSEEDQDLGSTPASSASTSSSTSSSNRYTPQNIHPANSDYYYSPQPKAKTPSYSNQSSYYKPVKKE